MLTLFKSWIFIFKFFFSSKKKLQCKALRWTEALHGTLQGCGGIYDVKLFSGEGKKINRSFPPSCPGDGCVLISHHDHFHLLSLFYNIITTLQRRLDSLVAFKTLFEFQFAGFKRCMKYMTLGRFLKVHISKRNLDKP